MKLTFSTPGDVLIHESLRLEVATLGAGDSKTWPDRHGEEALYVLDGAVELDGTTVPTGGAVILHADTPCHLTTPAGARLAHFRHGDLVATRSPEGTTSRRERRGRHVLGPGGLFRSGSPAESQATWFADSTCEGCDVALFRVERDTPGNRGRAHSHSVDEILYVVDGTIHLGAHELAAGAAVFIPADTRYAITCGETRHAFLNYRPTASIQHYEGDVEPLPENALGRGGELVGDLLE